MGRLSWPWSGKRSAFHAETAEQRYLRALCSEVNALPRFLDAEQDVSAQRSDGQTGGRWWLQVLAGPCGGSVVALPSRRAWLGTSPGAEIYLPVGELAPLHCLLHCHENSVRVEIQPGEGSTFVNGRWLERTRLLGYRDEVWLGETGFKLRRLEAGPRMTKTKSLPMEATDGSRRGDRLQEQRKSTR